MRRINKLGIAAMLLAILTVAFYSTPHLSTAEYLYLFFVWGAGLFMWLLE